MNAFKANIINSVSLVLLGLYGYLGSDTPSFTALIPVVAGVVLFILGLGIKKENKVISHVAVVFTLLLLISLFKPLSAAIGRNDFGAILRVSVMLLTSAFAMFYFVKSFWEARKKSE